MAAPMLQQQSVFLKSHCTKSTRHLDNSACSMPLHEKAGQRKRRRDQPACEDVKEQASAKRGQAPAHNYPPEFWDELSKIELTRRALKELDRRTAKERTTPRVQAVKRPTQLLRSDTRRLLRFAKNGGPDLNRLRGYAETPQAATSMSRSSSRKGKRTRDSGLPSSAATTKTSTTGPYNAQFQQMLTDRGVFPDGYEDLDGNMQEPANIDSLREFLAIDRSSLSPSRFTATTFKEFQRANRMAKSEAKAMSSVIPAIAGVQDSYCTTQQNTLFNNVEKFAPGLKMAQPDKYYGARPEQVDDRVLRDLGKYIIPSTDTALPVAPNFFLEGKSAAGRADVAQRQVMHDNAHGARAMHQLQNYGRETPVYDGNAYTIGSSYSDGQLKLYATHPRQSATGRTEYHMTQLRAYAMTDTADSFRQGAAAYRNSRDFAKEQRDRLIAEANATAQSASTNVSSNNTASTTGTSFATTNVSFGSDTSTDELALHYDPASDESDGKARARKRTTQPASAGQRLRSSTHVPAFNVQRSNAAPQGNRSKPPDNEAEGSSSSDDAEYVTADGEQDEDEDEDEDDDEHGQVGTRLAARAGTMKRGAGETVVLKPGQPAEEKGAKPVRAS